MRREAAGLAGSVLRSRWLDVPWYLAAFLSALAIFASLLFFWLDACTLIHRFGRDLMTLYEVGAYVLLSCTPLRVLQAIARKRLPWLLLDAYVLVGVLALILLPLALVPFGFCS